MSTARKLVQVVVAELVGDLLQARIDIEEVFAEVFRVLGRIGLHLTVGDLVHTADKRTVDVFFEQRVPLATPDDLHDVPACPAEDPF